VRIPALKELISQYEAIMQPIHPTRVVGVALSCHGLSDAEARDAVANVANEVQLPTTDCIRFGADVLADAVMKDSR
jgi:uncharacterized NAD-dependent epimerase/dehydratase family protein